jgi:hypothetical protein
VSRALLAAACGVGLMAFCSEARAQYAGNELGDVKTKHFESKQRFALEFRFAPYSPQIDSGPGVTGSPYASVFGSAPQFEFAAELDWQVLHIPHFGSIGPGASFGYTSASTPAPFTNCPPAPASCQSGENTKLEIFPMYLVAVLRADVFLKDFHIPLVPYAKAGVGLAFWRASNDVGTSTYNGVAGNGHTWGTHFAFGLALSLNWLDPRASRSLDESVGINNVSLFGEWMFATLNNFGSKDTLYVGTSTFVGGLSLEF